MTGDAQKIEYLYMFGYEHVDEHDVNEAEGTDYESIGFFRIRAASAVLAVTWGRTLSDWYVAKIYGDQEPGRWARGEFASWIEEKPDSAIRDAAGQSRSLEEGQFPDFDSTRVLFYD